MLMITIFVSILLSISALQVNYINNLIMPMDATQREQAMTHLLRNVLRMEDNSVPQQGLEWGNAMDIDVFLTMPSEQFALLKYTSAANRQIYIRPGDVSVLLQLQYFLRFARDQLSNPLDELAEVTHLDNARYRQYILTEHVQYYRRLQVLPALTATSGTSSTSTTTSTSSMTPDELFRRQIKIDSSRFPILKDDKDFDKWNRETSLLCAAYGLENVLDHSYQPTGLDDITLFRTQKAFMMTIWMTTLQTETGRTAVRKHAAQRDAQAVYKEVVSKARSSNAAAHTVNDLYRRITNMRLTDKWPKTYEAFVLDWNDLVKQYDEMVPSAQQLDSSIKLGTLHPTNLVDLRTLRQTSRTGL